MDVIEFQCLSRIGQVYAVVRGSTGYHLTRFDFETLDDFCSCWGWITHRKCKHVKWLIDNAWRCNGMAVPFGKRKKEGIFRKFKSSLSAVNEMFDGNAYSAGEIFGVYAPPGTGKTLYAIQEAVWLTSQGYNVLYIETEGSGEEMLMYWAPIFAERFDGDLNKLYFESRRTLETLAEYLGFEIRFVTKSVDEDDIVGSVNQLTLEDLAENGDSDGSKKKKKKRKKKSNDKSGKIEVMYKPLDVSLIEKDIEKFHIDFIILDSLSMPIRSSFPPDQQNNPSKSFVEARILQKFIELQEKFNVGVLVVMHASMNPARPYESSINFRGGLSVRHAIKRIVFIGKRDAKEFDDYRKFWLIRSANAKPWSKVAVVKINDLGYVDVPVSEWKDAFTAGELKKVKEMGVLGEGNDNDVGGRD